MSDIKPSARIKCKSASMHEDDHTSPGTIHFACHSMRPQCYKSGKVLKIPNSDVVVFIVGECK